MNHASARPSVSDILLIFLLVLVLFVTIIVVVRYSAYRSIAQDTTVSLEAEDATLFAPVQLQSMSKASGGKYIQFGKPFGQTQPLSDTLPCRPIDTSINTAFFTITIPSSDTYRIFSRIKSDNSYTDAYLLQIDENCPFTVGNLDTMVLNNWQFVDFQNGKTAEKIDVEFSIGTHTIKIIGSEQGLQLDRILLTTNTSCVPIDTGDNCLIETATNTPPQILTPTVTPVPTDLPLSIDSSVSLTPRATPFPTGPYPTQKIASKRELIIPVSDSFVDGRRPNSNYGTLTSLAVDGTPIQMTYLKFNLAPLFRYTIMHATLRLYTLDRSTDTQYLRFVENSGWLERSITYNNRPVPTQLVSEILPGDKNEIEIDVTQIVMKNSGEYLTLSIDTPFADGFDIYSKESKTYSPLLIVDYFP